MLRNTREVCRSDDDKYIFALCHMDLSEIYLDLNLSQEAAETAREGASLFESLSMGYENAKCVANLAIALGQQGQAFRALELFSKAREIFVREQNSVWPSLIDLYQALLLCDEGRLFEARRLCAAALEFFDSSTLKGKRYYSRPGRALTPGSRAAKIPRLGSGDIGLATERSRSTVRPMILRA